MLLMFVECVCVLVMGWSMLLWLADDARDLSEMLIRLAWPFFASAPNRKTRVRTDKETILQKLLHYWADILYNSCHTVCVCVCFSCCSRHWELGELCVLCHPIISLMSCPQEEGGETARQTEKDRQSGERTRGMGDRERPAWGLLPFLPSIPLSPHL